ncbi:hypothetical protein [Cellulomonas sp. NPDC058312]|uniref:hypothetical protein n=1 Tax=Cellulomonas sp. NPDC058312 TaxID=3346441 RepID=UPI0036EDC058
MSTNSGPLWTDVVVAVAAVLTLAVAVWAAWYARGQVQLARQTREDQSRPFVVVDFESSVVWLNVINLVVVNVGQTLARDVKLTFDPPLSSSQDKSEQFALQDSALVTEGISAMPPGRRIETLFDLSHERIKTELPMRYRVTVECADAHGRKQAPLSYDLDLSTGYRLRRVAVRGAHDAAEALRSIDRRLASWTVNHFGPGIRVWNSDLDQRLDEEHHEMERLAATRARERSLTPDPTDLADEPAPVVVDDPASAFAPTLPAAGAEPLRAPDVHDIGKDAPVEP